MLLVTSSLFCARTNRFAFGCMQRARASQLPDPGRTRAPNGPTDTLLTLWATLCMLCGVWRLL